MMSTSSRSTESIKISACGSYVSKTEADKVYRIRKQVGPATAESVAYLLTELAAVELIGCGAKQKYRASFMSHHTRKYITSMYTRLYNEQKVIVKDVHYLRRLINIRLRGPLYVISEEAAGTSRFVPFSTHKVKEALKSFSDLNEDSINRILTWLGSSD